MDRKASQPHPTIALVVLTYLRPQQLRVLIPQLVRQGATLAPARFQVNVTVIDNDPSGGAAVIVEPWLRAEALPEGVRVLYEHEPRPGISQARNRALDVSSSADFLAFIDDDERPSAIWLASLLDTQLEYGCAAVVGPVVPEFESAPDEWITGGEFFIRRRWPTGTIRDVGPTSNILFDLSQVRPLGLRFDGTLGLTGGEDTLFTATITRSGGRIVWCDEAVVYDLVPRERLNREWVLRRRYRFGTTRSLVALKLEENSLRRSLVRFRLTASGLVRVAGGGLKILGGMATGSTPLKARGARTLAQGAGLVAGSWGSAYEAYARPTDQPEVSRYG